MSGFDRRAFVGGGAAMAAWVAASPGRAVPADIESVYKRAIVLDTLSFEDTTFDPRAALAAGLTGVVLDIKGGPREPPNALSELDKWDHVFTAAGSPFQKILKGADFAEAKRNQKFAIILNSQDAGILGTEMPANGTRNIDMLRTLHGKGLRILQLTYTTNNGLGAGYADIFQTPLARLGILVVEEMNRLGMLIDTSHCAEQTTLDAIQRSIRPVAVTHAGCYALFPDKRNKSDAVIRALAQKGGYLGIYNMTLWMTSRPNSSVETIVDHVDHAVKVGGIDLVGFGSDHEVLGDPASQADKIRFMQTFFDTNRAYGVTPPTGGHVTASGMDGPDRLHVLALALSRRGYGGDAVEKILGGNFVRVFTAACG